MEELGGRRGAGVVACAAEQVGVGRVERRIAVELRVAEQRLEQRQSRLRRGLRVAVALHVLVAHQRPHLD